LPFGTSSPHASSADRPLRGRTKTMVTSHQTTESTDDYDESRTGWNEVHEASLLALIGSPTMPERLHLPRGPSHRTTPACCGTRSSCCGALHCWGILCCRAIGLPGPWPRRTRQARAPSLERAVKIGCL